MRLLLLQSLAELGAETIEEGKSWSRVLKLVPILCEQLEQTKVKAANVVESERSATSKLLASERYAAGLEETILSCRSELASATSTAAKSASESIDLRLKYVELQRMMGELGAASSNISKECSHAASEIVFLSAEFEQEAKQVTAFASTLPI